MRAKAPAAALLTLICLSAAWAGTIEFENGDRINASGFSLEAGKLAAESPAMGKIEADLSKVTRFETGEEVAVRLRGGTLLFGALVYRSGGQATVATESGEITVSAADVTGVGPREAPPGEAPAEAPAWHGAFALGISGQSGNTETFAGNGRLSFYREHEKLRLEGYASGRYAEQDGERSENQQRAGGRTEYSYRPDRFWYAAVDLERDEFKDLDFRTTGSAGLGRTWWREGENWWKTAFGVGVTHESYRSGGSELFPQAELTSDYSRRINETLTFTNRTKLALNLDETDDWRAENDAALAVDLAEDGVWQLRMGLRHEYDSLPAEGVDRLDTYYYLNTVRNF